MRCLRERLPSAREGRPTSVTLGIPPYVAAQPGDRALVDVLYSLEREFTAKTFEAIDAPSAALPVHPAASDADTALDLLSVDDPRALDGNVRRVDPAVVVVNHRCPFEEYGFHEAYPVVHVRHGASVGRGEIAETNREVLPYVDSALAPGTRWAEGYPEAPARSVVRRCRERIAEMDNVIFDTAATPRESMRAADVLISDYSGIVAEWLHTGRPLLQLADRAGDREVPPLGHTTERLDVETVDRLYAEGYAEPVARRRERVLDRPGIPMDGRAGERAAAELKGVAACTA